METNHKTPWYYEDLMINLIKNDLIHLNLVNGLRDLSLDSALYRLNLDEVIFWLIGFREYELKEELKNWYFDRAAEALKLKVSDSNEDFELLAREIFCELKDRKETPLF